MGKAYNNFAELMANIFQPMFEATLHPSKHPEIYTLLAHIGGKVNTKATL
jgi:AMP deaminase